MTRRSSSRFARLAALIAALMVLTMVIAACGDIDPQASDAAAAPAEETVVAEPVDLPALPQPEVAPPVGQRDPQLVKVELESIEIVAKLDDGVAYEFWTFDGTIPGPMVRVRQGDTVELTLKNHESSAAVHSIDLHAVTGPGGGAAVTQVGPGHDATFRFEARHPGVYVYHCATPPVPMHVTNGMYGLIVVEPPEGLEPVDHEYYVMQGDFYPEGERGTKGVRGFDMTKMLDEQPEYVVFNGSVGALTGENALKAEVGDTVRLFFGVGGVNVPSSLHVIGEVFDRVQQEGASEWSTNVQTTFVPAGGVAVAEFTFEVPGTYTIVDHSLGRVMKGAAGEIIVEGSDNPAVFEVVKPGNAGAAGH